MTNVPVSALAAVIDLRNQIEDRLSRTEDFRVWKALDKAIVEAQSLVPTRFGGASAGAVARPSAFAPAKAADTQVLATEQTEFQTPTDQKIEAA